MRFWISLGPKGAGMVVVAAVVAIDTWSGRPVYREMTRIQGITNNAVPAFASPLGTQKTYSVPKHPTYAKLAKWYIPCSRYEV